MVFSNLIFLYLFLPVCLIAYFFCQGIRAKNAVLILFSLIFYAWGAPKYVFLMIFSILVNYVFGLLMDKHRENKKRLKLMLVISVIIDLGLLSVFKYTDFIITNINSVFGADFDLLNIALPIGISFFTFQGLSYVIDVYREPKMVSHSFKKVLLYIAFFPQLIAGPSVKYHDVEQEIDSRRTTPQETALGIRRFICGLSI